MRSKTRVWRSIEEEERYNRTVELLGKFLITPVVLFCLFMAVESGSVKWLGKSPLGACKEAVAKFTKSESSKTSLIKTTAGEI